MSSTLFYLCLSFLTLLSNGNSIGAEVIWFFIRVFFHIFPRAADKGRAPSSAYLVFLLATCVCGFRLCHCKGFFHLQCCLGHTWVRGSTILFYEYFFRCFCQVHSSPFLKLPYFTSKDKTQQSNTLKRKWYDIFVHENMIYIYIRCNLEHAKPKNDKKILKIRRLL